MATVLEAHKPAAIPMHPLPKVWLIGACFVLSGATGLIYEVLWARMLGLVFGATTLAVSTVLAAFMGGLALGSALAGRLASRVKRPVRVYGLLEIGIALYALAVPLLFSWVDNLYALIWQQLQPGFFAFSVWRFALSCLMLLVPTTLMGATLPVLSAALVRSPAFKSTSVTRLYTCNLVGAICGTVAAGFFLLPILGVGATIYTAAAINILIGIVAIVADRTNAAAESDVSREYLDRESPEKEDQVESASSDDLTAVKFWLFCAFISGFVTISAQVAWTRVLTMIIGSSTYGFTIVVALFLIGLSSGAYLIGRKRYAEDLRTTIFKVELITAISLILSLKVVNWTPALLVNIGLRLNVGSWGGLLLLQILAAGFLVLLPAFLMGAVMPLVLVWASKGQSSKSVQTVGRSYALNTLGAIAGAFCAGFILIPRTSTRYTILFAAALCLVVAALAYQPRSDAENKPPRGLTLGLAAVVILLLFVFAPGMNLGDLSIGAYDSLVRALAKTREGISEDPRRGPATHVLLMYEEGPTSTVSVRKDWDITSLAINGRTNASDREDMPTQVMLGQLPLLLAPSIKNGLVVGFASGVSAGAMLQSPLESLECVELEPATITASRFFEHVNNLPLNDTRLRLIIDDARTYLRVTPTRFNVIVSEPNHPWVPGVANLFTREFFELGRNRLTEDGVFVQWLQIYQLSPQSLRSVLATYQSVFPHVMVFRVGGATKGKDLILVGSRVPLTLDRLAERMREPRTAAELARIGLTREEDVRSWYVCNETQLTPAVAGAVINTDDNMHIETTVPREAFLPLMQSNSAWIESLAK
ncbi:MAG: fused MFS/spermidine synthase [Pyrinomonadaceae bacterium]